MLQPLAVGWPVVNVGDAKLHHADCRDVLRSLPDNSIDSVVTDPPYALVSIVKRFGKPGSAPAKGNDAYMRASAGFMFKTWDTGEVAFSDEFWAEVLRVLKPGGHVVAFGGTRTYHRMAVAIEDAGFEIRDRIRHDQNFDAKFGPLFESLNDEQRGALLELLNDYGDGGTDLAWVFGSGFPKSHNQPGGLGTALKPAHEPILLARKPLDGTVAENIAKWGVGALNIDGCRVPTSEPLQGSTVRNDIRGGNFATGHKPNPGDIEPYQQSIMGRWPANIVHDGSDEVLAAFPDAPGQMAKAAEGGGRRKDQNVYGAMTRCGNGAAPRSEIDKSAARFFYCAKASRKDRDEGLSSFETKTVDVLAGHRSRRMEEVKRPDGAPPAVGKNTHPTVKPTALMQWLCRLVTPPGGVILDPFMGSGSTGKAALLEGFQFIGCEREDEYMPIAQARISAALRREPQRGANDNQRQYAEAQSDLFGAAA